MAKFWPRSAVLMAGWLVVVGTLLWRPTSANAQPAIDHAGIECLAPGKFAVILSGIKPGLEVQTAKVYFRSTLYPDFYYVEMTYENGRFQGVLPQPSPETKQVVYYLEAIDRVFNGTRSIEWDPFVKECDDDPAAAYFTGDGSGIVIGATTAGQSALPPGFSAAGIIGTIASTGAATGVGGGVGAGTAVAVGAAAAGAVGAVVAVGGPTDEEPATTTVVAALTTTTAAMTTTSSSAPPSTGDPGPSSTSTIATTTSPAPTTTSGPATTSTPATTTIASTTSIVATTSIAATTSVPITTSSIATTTIAPPVTACLAARKLNSCVWEFNASCSSGPIVQYDWVIDPGSNMPAPRPPNSHAGQVVVIDWNPPTYGGCSGSPNISVQLTVTGPASQTDSVGQNVNIDLKAGEGSGLRASVQSFLAIPPLDGTSSGVVVLNEARTATISNAAPYDHVFPRIVGKNTIQGFVDASRRGQGSWTFDFSASPHFVPGTIRVEQGSVRARDGLSVVFGLAGDADERIRFTFELSR